MKGVFIAIVVLAMVQLMVEPTRAITCDQVNACLGPCMSYLENEGTPEEACCKGVKDLKGMASTTDKRAACDCVKQAASNFPSIKDDAAQTLPAKCNVQMDIPICRDHKLSIQTRGYGSKVEGDHIYQK